MFWAGVLDLTGDITAPLMFILVPATHDTQHTLHLHIIWTKDVCQTSMIEAKYGEIIFVLNQYRQTLV